MFSFSKIVRPFFTSCNTIRRMHFLQFVDSDGLPRIGIRYGEAEVINLHEFNSSLPSSLCAALQQNPGDLLATGHRCLNAVSSNETSWNLLKLPELELLPPITKPDKVLAVGLNYYDHCEEMGAEPPTEPLVFNKFPSTICSSRMKIPIPPVTEKLDYEAELVIVIGKKAYQIPEEEADDYIFGYTAANDVSARDLQVSTKNGGQILLAKSLNNFCPLAPFVTTKESLNIENLTVTTRVNGDVRQSSNTKHMIFKPRKLVSYITSYLTLLPGDLILTGTPPGVGAGMKPQQFLKQGDVVEVEIENIGTVDNQFV